MSMERPCRRTGEVWNSCLLRQDLLRHPRLVDHAEELFQACWEN